MLRGIDRSGAAVVGLDIALSVPTSVEDDATLAGAIRALGGQSSGGRHRLVLVDARLPETGPLADPAVVRAAPRGSDRMPIDDDGVIRRVAMASPGSGGGSVPAFALAILAQLDGVDAPAPSAGELWRINFVGPSGSFLTIPSDALAELGQADTPPVAEDNPLRGRIVLVGATFAESRDFVQTPVGRMAGVEVHANVVHMLATRSFIRPAGWLASLGIQLAAVGVTGLLLAWWSPIVGTLVALVLAVAIGVPASYLAFHGGGYGSTSSFPSSSRASPGSARRPSPASVARLVRAVRRARRHGGVARREPDTRGRAAEVSVLVSDLRGFRPCPRPGRPSGSPAISTSTFRR